MEEECQGLFTWRLALACDKHTRSLGSKSRNVLDQQGGREGPLEINVLEQEQETMNQEEISKNAI